MFTEAQLIELAKKGESQFTERKDRRKQAGETRKTLVAFANTVPEGQHGILFLGISDKGQVKGVENSDQAQKDIVRVSENECYPPVKCIPQLFTMEQKEVLAIIVPHSKERPHFAGLAYVRRGSESRQASKELFEEMISARNTKAGKILQYKGKIVTVRFPMSDRRAMKYSLSGTRQSFEDKDCLVERCDAFSVRLMETGPSYFDDYSLENLRLSTDPIHNRLRIEILENP